MLFRRTFSRRVISGRSPLRKDETLFQYDYDSEEDWVDEEEGESLCGADESDDEVDDRLEEDEQSFFVPDGYLSEGEGFDVGEGPLKSGIRSGGKELNSGCAVHADTGERVEFCVVAPVFDLVDGHNPEEWEPLRSVIVSRCGANAPRIVATSRQLSPAEAGHLVESAYNGDATSRKRTSAYLEVCCLLIRCVIFVYSL